jgi:hypothetical protein
MRVLWGTMGSSYQEGATSRRSNSDQAVLVLYIIRLRGMRGLHAPLQL